MEHMKTLKSGIVTTLRIKKHKLIGITYMSPDLNYPVSYLC